MVFRWFSDKRNHMPSKFYLSVQSPKGSICRHVSCRTRRSPHAGGFMEEENMHGRGQRGFCIASSSTIFKEFVNQLDLFVNDFNGDEVRAGAAFPLLSPAHSWLCMLYLISAQISCTFLTV
uniref:Uncharacterized protein n=1 Tax=Triticum urartu TaxID=4572 RepID=A0A8R7TZ33_TRIUA